MADFQPIEERRLYMRIVKQIEEMIYRGELKRGDKLPSERELKQKLNVSRASIREAFSALEMVGIIESRPGEGTFIKQADGNNLLHPLSLILMLEDNIVEELVELRRVLEVDCARLASERATAEDIKLLEEYVRVMDERAGYDDSCIKADRNFHYAIARASGNRVLYDVMMAISEAMDFHIKNTRTALVSDVGTMRKFNVQHKRILQAIKEHDPDGAMHAMREHLNYVEKLIRDKMNECEGG